MAGISPTGPVMGAVPTQLPQTEQIIDYSNLPCPIPYEEIQREAMSLFTHLTLFHLNVLRFFLYFLMWIELDVLCLCC